MTRDIEQPWGAQFRHSAGELTTRFLRAARDERLLGWRSGGRVLVPPRDTGLAGEWVDVGPRATLLAASSRTLDDGSRVALVAIDGAHGCCWWRVRGNALRPGSRIHARFASERRDSPVDVWFEPEGA